MAAGTVVATGRDCPFYRDSNSCIFSGKEPAHVVAGENETTAPARTGRPADPRRVRAALPCHAEREEGRADRGSGSHAIARELAKSWLPPRQPRGIAGVLQGVHSRR